MSSAVTCPHALTLELGISFVWLKYDQLLIILALIMVNTPDEPVCYLTAFHTLQLLILHNQLMDYDVL